MYKNLDMQSLGITGTQSEIIELALSFGFKGMSLDMDAFARQVGEYGLPHARRLIDSARIQVATFRGPAEWNEWTADEADHKEGSARLAEQAELAAALGCTRCLLSLPPASDVRPYHENFEFHRARLSEMAARVAPHGVRLVLEFQAPAPLRAARAFQFIHTLEAVVQLVKSVAEENVGLVVDLWQIHVAGEQLSLLQGLPADRLLAVYLSDLPPGAHLEEIDEQSRLPAGESGVIDSVAALQTLAGLGFDGPVTPRADRRKLPGKNRDQIVKLAGQQLDQLWNEAGLDSSGRLATAASG